MMKYLIKKKKKKDEILKYLPKLIKRKTINMAKIEKLLMTSFFLSFFDGFFLLI